MRLISIADDKGRDAMVGIASCAQVKKEPFVEKTESDVQFEQLLSELPEEKRKRYIKSSVETDGTTIIQKFNGDMDKVAENLINEDPDIDLVKEGMEVPKMHRIYITQKNETACNIHFEERIFDNKGSICEVRPFSKSECNIQNENFPIKWTGLSVPYETAMSRYVFTHHYQLFHTNGLTYEFLYSMAKELSEKKCLMLVGGGKDGMEPIVLRQGGKKYRAFMSGMITENSYALFLHFTQFDLEDYL